MLTKRKGISTFIATLLLVVLAVAAGVVIYAYTMGYLGGFGQPTQMGAIAVDTSSVTSDGVLTAYIRNIGKTSVIPTDAYILDAPGYHATHDNATDPQPVLKEGSPPLPFEFDFKLTTTPLTSGKTYNFKIVCKDNTQLSFPLKAP